MTTAPAIELLAVGRDFGPIRAVDAVSFDVARGEIFGLIGHNGAGKSTLFKMMLGLLAPSRGEIRLCGQPVHQAGFREVRRQIGYLPENLVLYDNLSGEETLAFFARLKGLRDIDACQGLLELVGLEGAAKRRVREYSKGMRQRLGFAQALLGGPQLLLLDEPTNGLDPQGIHDFYAVLDRARARGATVILTSHILAEIEQRVDRLALVRSGALAALGSVAELSAAIALPLRVDMVAPESSHGVLRTLLASCGFATTVVNGEIRLEISRDQKMHLLHALADTEQVKDIRFVEPSLEAVFLGHQTSARL